MSVFGFTPEQHQKLHDVVHGILNIPVFYGFQEKSRPDKPFCVVRPLSPLTVETRQFYRSLDEDGERTYIIHKSGIFMFIIYADLESDGLTNLLEERLRTKKVYDALFSSGLQYRGIHNKETRTYMLSNRTESRGILSVDFAVASTMKENDVDVIDGISIESEI